MTASKLPKNFTGPVCVGYLQNKSERRKFCCIALLQGLRQMYPNTLRKPGVRTVTQKR